MQKTRSDSTKPSWRTTRTSVVTFVKTGDLNLNLLNSIRVWPLFQCKLHWKSVQTLKVPVRNPSEVGERDPFPPLDDLSYFLMSSYPIDPRIELLIDLDHSSLNPRCFCHSVIFSTPPAHFSRHGDQKCTTYRCSSG